MQLRRFFWEVRFLLLLCCALPAWSQANVNENLETAFIYVDTVKGSDKNPGTKSLPLKTIGAAVSLAETNNQNSVGSRVIINPGTYREVITVAPPHNSSTLPITFEAATDGTVYISGAQQYTGWKTYSGNSSIYTNSWSYSWGLCNTLSAGAPTAPDIVLRREMVFVNGTHLTQVLSFNELGVGTFYVDEKGKTIYMWPPSGVNVGQADIEVATQPTLWTVQGQSNVVLRGLTFEYANSCRENAAVQVTGYQSVSNVLLDTDNFVWNNAQGLNISVPLTYYTLQNSVANHNGEAGFEATKTLNGLLQSNQASYNNWRGAQGAYYWWNAAGGHFYRVHDLTINSLTAAYNQGHATHFDTDNEDITISSMVAYGNVMSGLHVEKNEGPVTISSSTICSESPMMSYFGTIGMTLWDSENVSLTASNLSDNYYAIWVSGVNGGFSETKLGDGPGLSTG